MSNVVLLSDGGMVCFAAISGQSEGRDSPPATAFGVGAATPPTPLTTSTFMSRRTNQDSSGGVTPGMYLGSRPQGMVTIS